MISPVMNVAVNVLAFLVIILICVLVHEMGHYVTALIFGVQVHEFSFGMGPLLWQKRGKRNLWSVRAVPVGGFVRLAGMGEELDEEETKPGMGFLDKKPLPRLVILAAGGICNVLLAVVLTTGLLMSTGQPDMSKPVIGGIMDGYPAQEAGIEVGDRVVRIAGFDTTDWLSIGKIVGENEDRFPLDVQVERDGVLVDFQLMPKEDDVSEGVLDESLVDKPRRFLLGITPSTVPMSFFDAFKGSFSFNWNMTKAMFKGLGMMIKNPGTADVMGPVGIASVAGDAARGGLSMFVMFLSMLSLNLAIINLLPFPALDGGRIIFVVVEMITGRRVSPEFEAKVHFVGIVILLALILAVTWKDIGALLGR